MRKIVVLLGSVLLAVGGPLAEAGPVPVLTLSAGGLSTGPIYDNGTNDSNPGVGVITFMGAIGAWSVNVTTGVTNPSPDTFLDLSSLNISSAGAGTLTITYSDAISRSFVNEGIQTAIGGTTNGVVNFSALFNDILLTPAGGLTFTGPAFAMTTNSLPQFGTDPVLTEQVLITHTSAGTTSFDAALAPVPEPSTLLLLGGGLLGAGGLARRRNRK